MNCLLIISTSLLAEKAGSEWAGRVKAGKNPTIGEKIVFASKKPMVVVAMNVNTVKNVFFGFVVRGHSGRIVVHP